MSAPAGAPDPRKFTFQFDPKSISDLKKLFSGLKLNLPQKQVDTFTKSVNTFGTTLKGHNKQLTSLINQFSQFNKTYQKAGSASQKFSQRMSQSQYARESQKRNNAAKMRQLGRKAKIQQGINDTTIAAKNLELQKKQIDQTIVNTKTQNDLNIAMQRFDAMIKMSADSLQKQQEKTKQATAKAQAAQQVSADKLEQLKIKNEMLLQAEQIKLDKAKVVMERTALTHKYRIEEQENNARLQRQKKEYNAYIQGLESILKHIPAGQMFAPTIARKGMEFRESASQVMLYKKHEKELNRERNIGGIDRFQRMQKLAQSFGIKDVAKTEKQAGGTKGKILGMAGKALASPMALMGGAAAIGLIGKAVSLGFESSPMLQQMFKLWKFGIMMIFRPIGDFFGFLFRPILILLLRKFIIPNYQKLMPVMIKLGTDLGNFIVSILDGTWIKKIDWKAILLAISPAAAIGVAIYDYLVKNPIDWSKLIPKIDWSGLIPKFDWSATNLQPTIDGITNFFKGLKIDETMKTAWTDLTTWFKGLKIEDAVKTAWTGVTDWFKGLKIEEGIKTAWTAVTGWFKGLKIEDAVKNGLDAVFNWFKGLKIEDTVKNAWTTFTGWFTGLKMPTLPKEVTDFGTTLKNALAAIPTTLTNAFKDLPKAIGNAFIDMINSLINALKNISVLGMKPFEWMQNVSKLAEGGIINEPVLGIGQRSGRGYLMGEAGAERVTPLNKSNSGAPITVNINISNMSGDSRDVAELRRVVLDIMQRINANRGR